MELVAGVQDALRAFALFFQRGERVLQGARPAMAEMEQALQAARERQAGAAEAAAQQRAELEAQLNSGAFPHNATERRRGSATLRQLFRPDDPGHADVVQEGYLFKRSSNVRRDWKRRWFEVRDGKLFYFHGRQQGYSKVLVCDVILCTVRECESSDLPFCFEIISPNRRAYLLQAESGSDMKEWLEAIRGEIEARLTQGTPTPTALTLAGVASTSRAHLGAAVGGHARAMTDDVLAAGRARAASFACGRAPEAAAGDPQRLRVRAAVRCTLLPARERARWCTHRGRGRP